MNKPFLYPFAKDGDRNTELPNANATDNSVSFQSGFTLPYELNPANGGKNLERKDMNEILFRICDAINNISQEVDKWIRLTTENLNEVKEKGCYYQNLDIEATVSRNYPQNSAGYLIVLNTGINNYGVTQIYKIWNSDKIFIRRTTSATAWSAWDSLVLTSEFNDKISALQNTDINLSNNKEDKTYYHTQNLTNINSVKDNRFYSHGLNTQNAFSDVTNYIFNIGAENGAWVRQISFPCTGNEIGLRRTTTKNDLNSWSAWDSVALRSYTDATFRNISDSYSKSETDTKLNLKRNISDSYSKTETNTQINNAVTAKGQRVKALWASVSTSDGAPTLKYQIGGCSISKISNNKWRITHNIGNLEYIPTGNILPNGELREGGCNITAITNNYIEVVLPTYDQGNRATQITIMIAY